MDLSCRKNIFSDWWPIFGVLQAQIHARVGLGIFPDQQPVFRSCRQKELSLLFHNFTGNLVSFMNDDAAKRPQSPIPFPINPSRLYLRVRGLVYIYIEAPTEIIFVLQRQYCAHNVNQSISHVYWCFSLSSL